MSAAAEWIFEGPDPEVGIFGDSVVHTCTANVEADEVQDAVVTDVSLRANDDAKTVDETTTLTCPVCAATTCAVETWPIEFFCEPGR